MKAAKLLQKRLKPPKKLGLDTINSWKKLLALDSQAVPKESALTYIRSRRLQVLERVLLEHITNIFAISYSGSVKFPYKINIEKVKITKNKSQVLIDWLSTGDLVKDQEIQQYLPTLAKNIRQELIDLHIIGIIPPLTFTKYDQNSQTKDIFHILSNVKDELYAHRIEKNNEQNVEAEMQHREKDIAEDNYEEAGNGYLTLTNDDRLKGPDGRSEELEKSFPRLSCDNSNAPNDHFPTDSTPSNPYGLDREALVNKIQIRAGRDKPDRKDLSQQAGDVKPRGKGFDHLFPSRDDGEGDDRKALLDEYLKRQKLFRKKIVDLEKDESRRVHKSMLEQKY